MDFNWILEIMRSPYIFLLLPLLVGYFCWHNVYDYNDLADAITAIGTNEAGILISYPLDINEDLTVPSNITLRFIRGGTLNVGKYSIRNAVYKWTLSGNGTNEYYLELATAGDPGLTEPPDVFEDDVAMRKATLGSLVVGEWNFGDNDTLGYETIYVRIAASADPDSKAVDYVEAAYKVTIAGSVDAGQYQIFEGDGSVIFSGTRVGNGLLKDMYPHWRGATPLEAVDVRGGIRLRDRTHILGSFQIDLQPIVTFIIYDVGAAAYGDWKTLFDSKGINATTFLETDALVGADLAPWLGLQAAGWEIGSHSKSHPYLTTLTEEQLEDEIGGSKTLLESWGFKVRNFCAPYGDFNESVTKIILEHYLGAHIAIGIANVPIISPFAMHALAGCDGDVEILADLQTAVDNAIYKGGWLMVGLHIADAPKITKIGALIDYIQALGVQICTMSEAEDLIGNLIDSRNFRVGATGEFTFKTMFWSGVPSSGTWKRSMIIWNIAPAAGGAPGWMCVASGTFSAATDNTGDTTLNSFIITGMADTSDFFIGDYVTVSAGFPAGIYKIIAKTASSVTLNAKATSTQANVTVATSDPVWKAMANLAA